LIPLFVLNSYADGFSFIYSTQADTPIDEETFNQIVELDEDDDTYDFSWGMASAYFSQVKTTFEEMDQAL
jgi:osomolarity two-component system phosphorelay intermediate protein YPD1